MTPTLRPLMAGLILVGFVATPTADPELKKAAIASIEAQATDLAAISDSVWRFAETALRETRSAATLSAHAEAHGFRVTRGVAGMPTAFTAEFGSGKPVIAILGEYDALPGISQKAQPHKEARVDGAAGHGCGHNLFGAASLGAAIAVKELIAAGRLRGTIRFYGTPAEESVGGKVYMARDGLFKDVDVALAWHPSDETQVDVESTQALVDFVVEFKGKTAHAAFDPWNGRSAADAVEAFQHGVNLMREHVRPTVRMHYVVQRAGDVPNVVPAEAKIWMWVRDSKRTGVEQVLERVKEIAKGAAMIAGVEHEFRIQAGDYEMLVNMTGAKLLQENMTALAPIAYTAEEIAWAKELQAAAGVQPVGMKGELKPLREPRPDPPGGSTDVGDVSWVVPTLHLSVATAPNGVPWHAWPVVASGGMSIGHKGMVYAAKALATTMVDLFTNEGMRKAIQAEFADQTKGMVYSPYIPPGPPPIPTGR